MDYHVQKKHNTDSYNYVSMFIHPIIFRIYIYIVAITIIMINWLNVSPIVRRTFPFRKLIELVMTISKVEYDAISFVHSFGFVRCHRANNLNQFVVATNV